MPNEGKYLPDDLPFEGWVDYVFDHPVLDKEWWWHNPESEYFHYWNEEANPARTLSYLTQLFSDPGFLISRFSPAQIDKGLTLIISPAASNHSYVLIDKRLPWVDRKACIEAMFFLYRDLMAPVYKDRLGHLERGSSDPELPTFACYMCWDIIPLFGGIPPEEDDGTNDSVLKLFERVLQLRAESCLESALHGLGHSMFDFRNRVEPIIRRFLDARTDISPALRSYGEQAATGYIQ